MYNYINNLYRYTYFWYFTIVNTYLKLRLNTSNCSWWPKHVLGDNWCCMYQVQWYGQGCDKSKLKKIDISKTTQHILVLFSLKCLFPYVVSSDYDFLHGCSIITYISSIYWYVIINILKMWITQNFPNRFFSFSR